MFDFLFFEFFERRLLPIIWEFRIEGCKELLHRSGSFIPHVRDPEGLPFDLSVAAIDGKAMFGDDGFDPAALVEILGGHEARK